MDAKKCDICGEYYTENNNECGLYNREGESLTGIITMHNREEDAQIDLCDACVERLTDWIKGDAIIIHKKTLGYLLMRKETD